MTSNIGKNNQSAVQNAKLETKFFPIEDPDQLLKEHKSLKDRYCAPKLLPNKCVDLTLIFGQKCAVCDEYHTSTTESHACLYEATDGSQYLHCRVNPNKEDLVIHSTTNEQDSYLDQIVTQLQKWPVESCIQLIRSMQYTQQELIKKAVDLRDQELQLKILNIFAQLEASKADPYQHKQPDCYWSPALLKDNELRPEFQDRETEFIIAKDVNNVKNFTVLQDPHAIFKQLLCSERSTQHYYEYMMENVPRVVYFDMDIDTRVLPYTYDDAEELKDALITETILSLDDQFGIQMNLEKDLLIYASHGKNKFSYHILVRSCKMMYADMKHFCTSIIEQVRKDYNLTGDASKFLDSGVYKSRQQMRLLGSTKVGAARHKEFNEIFTYKGQQYTHKYPMQIFGEEHKRFIQLRESLISGPGLVSEPMVELPDNQCHEVNENTESFLVKDLDEILSKYPYLKEQFKVIPKDDHYFLQRIKPGECLPCKKSGRESCFHENQNGRLQEDEDGNVTQICYHGTATRLRSLTPYKPKSQLVKDYVPYDTGKLPLRFKKEEYNERYVHNLDPTYKYHIVDANMGTGKTYTIEQFINDNGLKSIVVVTPRQSFAREIAKRLGDSTGLPTYYYSEVGVKVPKEGILIVEYESVCKFDGAPPFDLLLFDEVTSSNAVISSRTMGSASRFRNTMSNTELLFQCCKYAVAMDAFMDDRTITLFDELCPAGEEVLYSKNNYQPNIRKLKVWNDQWCVMHELSQCLINGDRIYIPVTSVSYAKALHKMVQEAGYSSLCITGKSSPKEKKMLNNCNKLFRDYQVVIVTSTITVGIDFNVPYFDKIFVFAENNTSVTARDVMQMMGRIRTVKDSNINMYCRSDKGHQPVNLKSIEWKIKKRLDNINRMEKEMKEGYALPADIGFTQSHSKILQANGRYAFEFQNSWYSTIHIMNLSEYGRNKNTYWEEFERLAKKIGYGFNVQPNYEETPEWEQVIDHYKGLFERYRIEATHEDEEPIEKAKLVTPEELAILDQKVQRGTAVQDDMIKIRKFHICKYFKEEPMGHTAVYFEKNKTQCLNALMTKDSTTLEAYLHDQSITQNPLRPKILFDKLAIIQWLISVTGFNCILWGNEKYYSPQELVPIMNEVTPNLNLICAVFEVSMGKVDYRFRNFPPQIQTVITVIGDTFKKWVGCKYGLSKDKLKFRLRTEDVVCARMDELKPFDQINNYIQQKVEEDAHPPPQEHPVDPIQYFVQNVVEADINAKMRPDDAYNLFLRHYSGTRRQPPSKQQFWTELKKTVTKSKIKGSYFYRLKIRG